MVRAVGGGVEGVLVMGATTSLVGTVVTVGGGGGCVRGTRDGVVRWVAPREVGCLWGLPALGLSCDAAGGGRSSIGASWGRGRGGGGAVVVLVVSCPLALREWWSWHCVDVCGRWSFTGLPG